MKKPCFFMTLLLASSNCCASDALEFCLTGNMDLGARYQGLTPETGEHYETTWCVVTENDPDRVFFRGRGHSNPDMTDSFSVAYLAPDTVRIVNSESGRDIEFYPADIASETLRVRRLDPARLIQDWRANQDAFDGVHIETLGPAGSERLMSLATTIALPLRGVVDARWDWNWDDPEQPGVTLTVDGESMFTGTGRWRSLSGDQANSFWQPNVDTINVAGNNWPAKVDMKLAKLADDVYLVQGVRTGFQHMVVDTDDGLVVADAPAGWVEFHQIPPADLVPGLGISGLAEQLVDFLTEHFPGRPILATAITHTHDDHAGGARAFAAAGGAIYTTRESAIFLANALNRVSMPDDRLSRLQQPAAVSPVDTFIDIGGIDNRVRLVNMGSTPHVDSMLGVWAIDRAYFFVSDIHVPSDDSPAPSKDRTASECWFADWAVQHLPSVTMVINSHSSAVTPVSRLQKYLEHPLCKR